MHQKLNRNNVDYNKQRLVLRKKLRKISVFFKSEFNFSTQNILSPHIWQRRAHGSKEKIIGQEMDYVLEFKY